MPVMGETFRLSPGFPHVRQSGESGIRDLTPSQFHEALAQRNPSYAAFSKQEADARKYEEETREAGRKMRESFRHDRDRSCTDDKPVKPHEKASPDFYELTQQARARMLSR